MDVRGFRPKISRTQLLCKVMCGLINLKRVKNKLGNDFAVILQLNNADQHRRTDLCAALIIEF